MDGFPIGFRFHPKDGELIFHYLGNRIKNEPLPHYGIIHDVSLYNYTPDQLTAMFYNYGEADWYFFTSREKKYRNGKRPDRAVGEHGYWKPSGKDQPVNLDDDINNIIVGSKRTLCFFQGKQPNGVKTSWKMQEYIADSLLFPPNQTIRNNCNNNGDDGMRLDDWVICKIYKSSHHEEKKGEENEGYSNEAFTTSSSQPSPSHHQVNHIIMSSTNYGGFFPPPIRMVSHVSLPPPSSSQIPHGMVSTNGPTELPPFQSGEEDDLLALESLLFPSTSNNYNDIYMQESVNYYSGGFGNNMVSAGREFHYYQEASSSTNINNNPPLEDEDNLNFDPSSLDNPPDNID